MKKTYLCTALLAGLVAAGCSQSETIGDMVDGAQTPVAFGTYVGKATNGRASEKTAFAENDKIGIFGYYTTLANYSAVTNNPTNFMFNQEVTKGASDWTYSPLKYWPNDVNSEQGKGKVSFFAYYPMAATGTAIALDGTFSTAKIGDPLIIYTASDQTKQVDLLWGVNITGTPYLDQTKPTTTTEKVTFTFKHALARVGFKIKLADDILADNPNETTVTIDKIEFGGKLTSADKEGVLTGSLTPSATLNLNNTTANVANWTSPATTDLYSAELLTEAFTNNGIFGGSGNAAFDAEITNTGANYLMIIPQDFSQTDGETQVRITYTVVTTDAAVNGGKSEIVNKHVADVTANFENGKAYTYTFAIGLTNVKVDVDTSMDWATQPDSDITVN